MMPVLTIIIGISLPGGLMLYWLVTTFLTVGQQYLLFNKKVDSVNKSEPEKKEIIQGEIIEEKRPEASLQEHNNQKEVKPEGNSQEHSNFKEEEKH